MTRAQAAVVRKRRRKSAFDRLVEGVMILFTSLVLTEPHVTAKQVRFAKSLNQLARRARLRRKGKGK